MSENYAAGMERRLRSRDSIEEDDRDRWGWSGERAPEPVRFRPMGDLQTDLQRVLDGYRRAFRIIEQAVSDAWRDIKNALAPWHRPVDPRTKHGPDMFHPDGRWQSTMCGAWLHRSCGLPDRCDCTCHGGTLR